MTGLTQRILVCLLALIIIQRSTCQVAFSEPVENARICFIVRTYVGHGSKGDNGLVDLLKSLQMQNYTHWEAMLIVMDNKPFPDLHRIVETLNDDRIWVFSEWIAAEYTPKETSGAWKLGYHNNLYNLTDLAVRSCHIETEWLVITNGDNEYGQGFNHLIAEQTGKYDVVAFDYYSRYQRVTAPPCERFAVQEGCPVCKRNHMQWCKTDLGSVAYSWARFIKEGMKFGQLNLAANFTGQDGLMAQVVTGRHWSRLDIPDLCLFDHSPSPQRCARQQKVWDDSDPANHDDPAGKCISREKAAGMLLQSNGKLEMIQVNLSVADMSPYIGGQSGPLGGQCIRKKGEEHRMELLNFFSAQCAETCDMEASIQHTVMSAQDQIITAQQGADIPKDWLPPPHIVPKPDIPLGRNEFALIRQRASDDPKFQHLAMRTEALVE